MFDTGVVVHYRNIQERLTRMNAGLLLMSERKPNPRPAIFHVELKMPSTIFANL